MFNEKRGGKKEKNFVKWIVIGLIVLAVLFLAFKIFFTGNVVSSTGSQLICSSGYTSCFDTGTSYSCYLGNTCPSTSSNVTSNQTSPTITTNLTGGSSITIHGGDSIYLPYGSYIIKLISTSNFSGITSDTVNFVNVANNVPFGSIVWSSEGVGTLTAPNGYSYPITMIGNAMNSSSERTVTISSSQYSISCISGTCSPTSQTNQTIIPNPTTSTCNNANITNPIRTMNSVNITCNGPVTQADMGVIGRINGENISCEVATERVNVGTSKIINGLNVSLISSTLSGGIISATIRVAGVAQDIILQTDVSFSYASSQVTIITVGNKNYLIYSISASTTQETIQISYCVPTAITFTCLSAGQTCGLNVNCCAGLTCQGGICATPQVPVCIPKDCTALSKKCGTVSNGCNGTLNCGTCSRGKTCVNGNCLGGYGDYCTTGSQCYTGRCKPLFQFLWFKSGNYCY